VKPSQASFALRELRAHLTRPEVAAIMAGVALVLGLSGPFDTWTTQTTPVRLLYWSLVVWLTYGAGFLVSVIVHPWLDRAHLVLKVGLTALAVAIAVFVLLAGLNLLIFGQVPEEPADYLRSFGVILAICAVIEAINQIIARHSAPPAFPTEQNAHPAAARPMILDRMPLAKRGPLLSLSVQDHYVEVTTTRGRELLLMRLGDAIRETPPVEGLQVHRSHWVAHDAVSAADRRGDGAILTLSDGRTIPVSRSFLPAVRDAGFLPRKGA
jgi:DNA-binding LytR/AlgR family response regulator